MTNHRSGLRSKDKKAIERVKEDQKEGMAAAVQADGGPEPLLGEHRCFFRLYALDRKLALPRGATRQQVEAAMKGHVLATAATAGRIAAMAEAVASR